MIASGGSEKKRAVPSVPKPKTLKDCVIRNVSIVMHYDLSGMDCSAPVTSAGPFGDRFYFGARLGTISPILI